MVDKKTFSYSINIDAGGYQYYDFRQMFSTDDYLPLKNFTIINTSGADIEVHINDGQFYYYIPSGTIFQEKDLHIYKMKIINTNTTAPSSIKLIIDNRLSEIDYLKALVYGNQEVLKK